jgi:hypothetical protein
MSDAPLGEDVLACYDATGLRTIPNPPPAAAALLAAELNARPDAVFIGVSELVVLVLVLGELPDCEPCRISRTPAGVLRVVLDVLWLPIDDIRRAVWLAGIGRLS